MKRSRLLFLTTVAQPSRVDALLRLLKSVRETIPLGMEIDHLILAQDNLSVALPRCDSNYRQTLIVTPDRLSLSDARNRLIALAAPLLDKDGIVAFPDDDAWYPAGLLKGVAQAFAANSTLDMWICQYGSTPVYSESILAKPAKFGKMLFHASSNTIFVRAAVAKAVGDFERGLGLGTDVPGGEDTEYAIRAYNRSRLCLVLEQRCVGHRDANPTLRARYYIGGLAALAYNLDAAAVRRAFVRKIVVGCYHVASGRMNVRDLFYAWHHAAHIYYTRRQPVSKPGIYN